MEDRLLIYNFADYLAPANVKAFRKAHAGTAVRETYYSTSEEMAAKIQSGGADYDLVVPGQNLIKQLGNGGHLRPLDHSLLPHMAEIQPEWRDLSFDPGNRYSVVKTWGYTGFYYRNDIVRERPKTWREFYALLPKYSGKGRINMLEGTTPIIAGAMIALGLDPDSEDAADYERALAFLGPLGRHITTMDAATYVADAQAGKIVMGQGWSGNLVSIAEKRDDITAVAPDGPAERFADNWCIPATAKHPVAAHAWIDFMLRGDVGLREMKATGYAMASAKTWALPGAAAFRDDPLVNVPREKLANYKFIVSPTPKVLQLRQQAYDRFRATR
jgi:spermidine/putrescine transport system substrate-binding protein